MGLGWRRSSAASRQADGQHPQPREEGYRHHQRQQQQQQQRQHALESTAPSSLRKGSSPGKVVTKRTQVGSSSRRLPLLCRRGLQQYTYRIGDTHAAVHENLKLGLDCC